MAGLTGFEDAFDSVAKVVERAAVIPDHREREVESPEVQRASAGGEVSVVVQDGKIAQLIMKPVWFADASAKEAAELIVKTANEALEQWAQQNLETLQNLTPDLKELHAAISTARSQLDQAWVATLAEVRNP